jgi:hypothetical protein
MEPEGSLLCSQQPGTGTYSTQINPVLNLRIVYLRFTLILFSHVLHFLYIQPFKDGQLIILSNDAVLTADVI